MVSTYVCHALKLGSLVVSLANQESSDYQQLAILTVTITYGNVVQNDERQFLPIFLLDTPYLMDHDNPHLMGPEPNSSTCVSTSMMSSSTTQTSELVATLAGRSLLPS